MQSNRKPTAKEEGIIELPIKKSSIILPFDWKDDLSVHEMNDGEMGSLYLFPDNEINVKRILENR